ncbi:unnamed protein product [Linum tenue]|uniref:Apyrase 7 n=1 Tax=Linum tenue TaxID=586396 RepID=A0AAV0M7P0_9ROSI|nr:unnamed protein product [Linum tenue]
MVLGKIAAAVSAATSRLSFSGSNSASVPYMSTGVSPPPTEAADHGFSFSSPAQSKANLRLSSSLQDLSSYRRLDPEEGDPLKFGVDKNVRLLQRENATAASFSKEKGLPPATPFLRRKWVRALLVFLCLLSLTFLTYLISLYVYSYWSQGSSKFYVVLDCGSTGTRVFVYQASIDNKKDGNLPIVVKSFSEGVSRKPTGRAYDRMETEPGLHMLVHNTSGLKSALKPLVKWAQKQIPADAHQSTSLFLYATAGVRRLPRSDSKWLLDKAWSILNESPFLCQREWIKIISGMEEAYFGWIALNYRTEVLGASPKKPTFGALDLGGSSLQVTFEGDKQFRNQTNLNLRIGAVNHRLSAYSLAGYGLNDAFDKSVVHILKRLPNVDLLSNKAEIKHPCLHSGYKEEYICSHCGSDKQDGVSPVIRGRQLRKAAKSGVAVKIIGAPNWEECSALAKIVVNLSEWSNKSPTVDCDLQPCALPEGLPRPYGQFYAISGFFVVYRFFNLSAEASLDDVLERGREFCERNWKYAKSSVPPQPFIEQYCFRAPYIVSLLREGLHITDSQIVVGSGSITWTLGVALLEAGKTFSTRLRLHKYEIFRMKIHPAVLLAILLMSLFMLLCALSCVGNWIPRFFRRPYLPLFRHNSASTASVLNIPSPFRFQRWSPMNTGDGRVKMPLSPTVASGQYRPFGLGHGLGESGVQLMEPAIYTASGSVSHSYSSNSLGQMVESSSMASFWPPHRGQMRLQSRRSQSREDLTSSVADAHMVKV